MVYTKSELKDMKKTELLQVVHDLQEELSQLKLINDKVDALNSKFDSLSSELLISKNANSLLCNKIKDLETRCVPWLICAIEKGIKFN